LCTLVFGLASAKIAYGLGFYPKHSSYSHTVLCILVAYYS
jgi:hypothetical protein